MISTTKGGDVPIPQIGGQKPVVICGRLEASDKLIVLATVDNLRRIECGELEPPQWRLVIQSCPSSDAAFPARNSIARIAASELSLARKTLTDLPREFEFPVYRQQGARLVRERGKFKVAAQLTSARR